MLTYYEVLSVTNSAPPAVIKAAYKALAQVWHPDKNPAPDAAENMRALNEAYAVLSDQDARAGYDEWLASGGASAPESLRKQASAPFEVDEEKLAQATKAADSRQRRTAAEWLGCFVIPVQFQLYRHFISSRDRRRV